MKMHPLIFLKEDLPSYEKIQQNWIFQYLDEEEKKHYLQARIPKYLASSYENYKNEYIQKIL